ncbi:MAG TPA: protein kinase [Gemmatimonadaceae bacterium]|nr:protein kinase [Gemmatimonadaceae bacterium]
MAGPVLDELQDALGAQYTLERELGRGGMSTVYLACDTKHSRRVALKVLRPELGASLSVERFRREITTLAGLHHPHILTVYDSGETAGCLWFTMPYVEGGSLRDRLTRETQLLVGEALRITREVASALAYAHGRGIIHRDIKPENVLLTEQGAALLADFGIARGFGAAGTEGTRLTETGMRVGTAQYMSPEQASGARALDARSDVYALGAVLYEMLVREPAVMSSEPLSVRRVRPALPEHLDAALRKALALAPADRWASAEDFAHALETAEWTAGAAVVTPAPTRRVLAAALTLGLAVVIGAGVWFAGTLTRTDAPAAVPGPLRLAVLPFENIGDSADAYFADGVTDAVRGKLTSLPGLEVIGSTSSAQYRHTTKTPREIGQELGVRYLLEGNVRWAKGPDGTSRVRVSPELIDAGTAADKWGQPFDAPLTDVFQVQSDIAAQVAERLQVALTPAAVQTLASRPTADLTAYDAYLRGAALANSSGSFSSPSVVHREGALFTEAVTRDSTFALAWAALARVQAREYAYHIPRPAFADSADQNSARALALAPNLADAHTARATYYLEVRKDPVSALHEDSVALVLAPHDANTLRQTGVAEETLGRWDMAEAHMVDAMRLDPRSVTAAWTFGQLETLRRQYDQARTALERALTLSPAAFAGIQERLLLSLLQGDLAGGRAFLRSVPPSIDRPSLVAYLATYADLGWALDSSDAERLLGLGPEAFDGDRGSWAFALTQQYAFRGDQRRARAYADTARAAWEAQLKVTPADPERRALLGVALAYLGRRDAAIREGEHAVALLPIARNATLGAYIQHQLARIYILVGETERALDALEPLLRKPYVLSPALLRIDPNFAPLRGNPRFERLATGVPSRLPEPLRRRDNER